MSKQVPLTPRTKNTINSFIFSPQLTPLQKAMEGKQANTNLVKRANYAIEEGVMAQESPERLAARQKIVNFLKKKTSRKSKVKRALTFQGGKHRKNTRKIKIPPVLVEAGVNIAEILAGGRQTRKNRKNLKRK